nr:reverse transcriptase domain-containing protein [Tanacetum cinerariifolium]
MMAIFYDMIEETMEVFMDDFSVFEDSFSSCLSCLDKMLKRCEDTNLVLNWEKCHFMVKESIVLGHKISKSGIEVDRAKVDVIAKLPYPTFVRGAKNLTADHLSRLENPHEDQVIRRCVHGQKAIDILTAFHNGPTEAPGMVKPEIRGNVNFEIKSQFMRELRKDTFFENKNEGTHDHVDRVLNIVNRWIDSLWELSTSTTSLNKPLSKGIVHHPRPLNDLKISTTSSKKAMNRYTKLENGTNSWDDTSSSSDSNINYG